MTPFAYAGVLTGLTAVGVYVWRSRREEHARRGHGIAEQLLPEISALVSSSDPNGRTNGEPVASAAYEACRDAVDRELDAEPRYAVETFYRSVASYRQAREQMQESFTEAPDDEAPSLGDRIRAKDQRDRLLKNVYDSGAFAIEKLEQLLR